MHDGMEVNRMLCQSNGQLECRVVCSVETILFFEFLQKDNITYYIGGEYREYKAELVVPRHTQLP